MLSIAGYVRRWKEKMLEFQQAQAMATFAALVKSGTSEPEAKKIVNKHYGRQFDWEGLFSPKASRSD